MKKFLLIVSILILMALSSVVTVWFMLQNALSENGSALNADPASLETGAGTESQAVTEGVRSSSLDAVTEPIVIQKSALTPTQQTLVEKMGLEGDSIVITPAMISCADEALGADRVEAIVAGDSPSILESISLVGCLKK